MPSRPSLATFANELRRASPKLWRTLARSRSVDDARRALARRLSDLELAPEGPAGDAGPLEAIVVRDGLRVLRNMLALRNVRLAGFDALALLRNVVRGRTERLPANLSPGFFEEFKHLFLAVEGRSRVYHGQSLPAFLRLDGREAAVERSRDLDGLSRHVQRWVARYPTGLDPAVVAYRARRREQILESFGASPADWLDWRWHVRHVARNADALARLAPLDAAERAAIERATAHRIPFGVTPYYAHLMDEGDDRSRDHAVRAQVLPPADYVDSLARAKGQRRRTFDFMREHDTSPVPLVTRRYPQICILKPYNTCPQICVYCQRNWEIDEVLAPGALAPEAEIERAVEWIARTPAIREVLVTGGDPLVMGDGRLGRILRRLAEIDHVERIRLGTRMPITVPFRISESLVGLLAELHDPPRRELCVVTHLEHVYEITPELVAAVQAIRRAGVAVYNQLVFTVENSRRFETAATRRLGRQAGIDPYYTFCPKGKEELGHYRVPIARLLQEAKEEARLFPGLVRTDETVFNVPRLGKNYLLRAQHHDLISILPDGRRVYEFHPWEKKIRASETFVFTDVPIREYLAELERRGEAPEDYASIWYYH
ncbi:MAG: KamA family radical SAM protein [Deltaproteobacteria bacterium]|nr:KamA family radical SAM protein [Deltaproteobacteria bacterium]